METGEKPILRETLAAISEILGPELLTVERAVIGLFFTGVKLSNGIAGACATPIKTIPEAVCCPTSAMAMPFPGKLRGRPALDLAKEALGHHGIRRRPQFQQVLVVARAAERLKPPAGRRELAVGRHRRVEKNKWQAAPVHRGPVSTPPAQTGGFFKW